jgi:heptosyltransferase III
MRDAFLTLLKDPHIKKVNFFGINRVTFDAKRFFFMKKRCAVVCSHGLGDGLIFLTLSHNLSKNGYEVDTYHSSLFSLQRWFPHLPIKPFPKKEAIPCIFSSYDKIVINSDHSEENCLIQKYALEKNRESSWILHATTCRGKHLPGDLRLDTEKSMVTNLLKFCQDPLQLTSLYRENGIKAPPELLHKKEKKRVVIHPTSRNEMRNWPHQKFVKLALLLKKEGYDPCFMVAPFERRKWEWVQFHGIHLPSFSSLDEMASFLYESSYLIGMDSGIGHLASCMQIETLTIFACKRKKEFWRPDWTKGRSVLPTTFLPNLKGLRLRDKYWKPFLSVKKVLKEFRQLVKETQQRPAS